MGSLSHARAVEMFHEQACALKEGGADVLWVETIGCDREFRAAAEAARLADMPWCGMMSFDTAGRTIMGVTSVQLSALVERLPNPPVAYGANCGVGAADLLRTVRDFVASGNERPIIAKGNAGIPHLEAGHLHYDGTPAIMADYACLARDMGVRIIGGCCGTTPAHLRAMRDALETRPAGPRPSLEEIAARKAALPLADLLLFGQRPPEQHALEPLAHADRPGHRRALDLEHRFEFVEQFERRAIAVRGR